VIIDIEYKNFILQLKAIGICSSTINIEGRGRGWRRASVERIDIYNTSPCL